MEKPRSSPPCLNHSFRQCKRFDPDSDLASLLAHLPSTFPSLMHVKARGIAPPLNMLTRASTYHYTCLCAGRASSGAASGMTSPAVASWRFALVFAAANRWRRHSARFPRPVGERPGELSARRSVLDARHFRILEASKTLHRPKISRPKMQTRTAAGALFCGRAAACYALWLLLRALARQPCLAYLLQYWALQSPRARLLLGRRPRSAQAAARQQLHQLLLAFI